MELYPRLYVGKDLHNPDKVIHKLKKHAKLLNAYVITLSRNPVDQLDIYKAGFLSQKYFRQHPPYVIGLAAGYDEAVDLVRQIAEETFAARGDCELKEYLKCYM